MGRLLFVIVLFVSAPAFAAEESDEPTIAEMCAALIERPDRYALVLKEDGSYDVLINAVTPRMGIFPQEKLSKILSHTPGGPTAVRGLPELARLQWTKTGRRLEYYSQPTGLFGKVVRYRLHLSAILTIEVNLELGALNSDLVRGLLNPFSENEVTALITGRRPSLSIDRLELLRPETRAALNKFFKFLRENESKPEYIEAVNQAGHI